MKEDQFWGIVDRCRLASAPDEDLFQQELLLELAALPTPEIQSFNEHRASFDSQLSRVSVSGKDLHEIVYEVWGGCSDDSFMDFRSSVMANGRTFYERMMADPISALHERLPECSFELRFEAALFGPLYRLDRDLGVPVFERDAREPSVSEADRMARAVMLLEWLHRPGDAAARQAFREMLATAGDRAFDSVAMYWLRRDLRDQVHQVQSKWPKLQWPATDRVAAPVLALIEAALAGDRDAVQGCLRTLEAMEPQEWAGSASRAFGDALNAASEAVVKGAAKALRGSESWAVVPIVASWLEEPSNAGRTFLFRLQRCPALEVHFLSQLETSPDIFLPYRLRGVGGELARAYFFLRACGAKAEDLFDAVHSLAVLGDPLGAAAIFMNPELTQPDRDWELARLEPIESCLREAQRIVSNRSRWFEELSRSLDEDRRQVARIETVKWLAALSSAGEHHEAIRAAYETSTGRLRTLCALYLGTLRDTTGLDEVLRIASSPPDDVDDQVLALRAIAALGTGARGASLEVWGEQPPGVVAACLPVARWAIDPSNPARQSDLIGAFARIVSLAIDATDQRLDELISAYEVDSKTWPARAGFDALRVIDSDEARAALQEGRAAIERAVAEEAGRERWLLGLVAPD